MRGALDRASSIPVRNPGAVRPWQHVLNPLSGYLVLAQALVASAGNQGGWNFGPSLDDARPVGWVADRLAERWPRALRWEADPGPHPHEATFLALDSTKARERLGWAPTWTLDDAIASIVEWYWALLDGEDVRATTLAQIERFVNTLDA
jgi:CDP-glucose 4,6-dehydratase